MRSRLDSAPASQLTKRQAINSALGDVDHFGVCDLVMYPLTVLIYDHPEEGNVEKMTTYG
jgi:hypothetical protein